MGRASAAGIALLLGLAAAGAGAAPEPQPPVQIRADSVEYERGRDVYVARGNVQIEQPGRRLTADWVTFHPRTGKGIASGHVVVTEGADTLHAEFLHFDVDTFEGVVFDGELDSKESRFRLAGEEVRKTGAQTYTFRRGVFTTCDCPDEGRDPWRIRAQEADLEFEGYGTARNTTFEILGVPVVWLPWMIYPLKNERQTGLLFPEISTSGRSGVEVGLPFFWAARDNLNVLLTPRYLTKRGFKPELELEYVFGEKSFGDFYATYISNDDEIDPDDPSTPFDPTRWGFEWIHDQTLPRDWRFKVDARALSDNLFTFDFQDFSEFREDRFVQSVAFLSGETGALGALGPLGVVGSVWWADDQQNPDDRDRDQFLLHRLPDLAFNLPARPLTLFGQRLAPAFDVQYSHFWARRDVDETFPTAASLIVGDDLFADTGIDALPNGEERNRAGVVVPGDGSRDDFAVLGDLDVEGDGIFQEGEPLADRGHRLVLNPRLGLPLRLADFLELYPEIGYHGTFYETDAQSLVTRHLFTAQLDARMRFERAFALPFDGGEALHLLEPRLGYTALSPTAQDDNPLFVPDAFVPQDRVRQLELMNVTRDPADRLDSVHAVTLAAGNRIYRRRGQRTELFADVTLASQYEINNDELGSVFLDGTLYPAANWRTRFNFGYDLDESEVGEGAIVVGWSSPQGHDFNLGYRYLRNIPRFFESFRFDDERFDEFEEGFTRVSQISLNARAALSRNWALFYNGRYSFERNLPLSNRGGVEYISRCQCWAMRLELEDNRTRGLEVKLAYKIMGLGRDEDPRRPFSGRRSANAFLDAE